MNDFPSAQDSRTLAGTVRSEAMEFALTKIKGLIAKTAAVGGNRLSIETGTWDNNLKTSVVTYLKAKGYSAELYYGSQRDPASLLNIGF